MPSALGSLTHDVIRANRCTLCGACLSLCPYLAFCDGRIVKLHD